MFYTNTAKIEDVIDYTIIAKGMAVRTDAAGTML